MEAGSPWINVLIFCSWGKPFPGAFYKIPKELEWEGTPLELPTVVTARCTSLDRLFLLPSFTLPSPRISISGIDHPAHKESPVSGGQSPVGSVEREVAPA